jgi:sodium transport system permease protein
VENVNLATPQQSGSSILFMLAFYGVYAALISGLASAVDSTAGERERGSLEPLLTAPVSPYALAFGKWLAVAAFSALVVVLTISAFYITLDILPLPEVGIPFVFGSAEWLRFVGVLVPLAMFFVGVLLLIGILGRTFREAQTNASLLLMVVGLTPLIQIFRQGKEPAWLALVPVTGHYSVLSKILRGDAIPAPDLAACILAPFAGAAICVWLLGRMLQREALLAGK